MVSFFLTTFRLYQRLSNDCVVFVISRSALVQRNQQLEFERNKERLLFFKVISTIKIAVLLYQLISLFDFGGSVVADNRTI